MVTERGCAGWVSCGARGYEIHSARYAGAAAALLIAVSGCADRRIGDALAAGCRPPAHESGLLAAYRSDSAFAIRPPEAVAVGPATVEKACIAVGAYGSVRRGVHAPRDAPPWATAAEVGASFALNVGFTQAELTAMYDPGLQATGWAPQRLDLAPLNTGEQQAGLYYCKLVNHVPSFLSVYERYIRTADRRANESVSPSPNGLWPEAGSLQVRITAIRGLGCSPT